MGKMRTAVLTTALAFGVLAALAALVRADNVMPHDIRVIDGDTIKSWGSTYRLVGYNAPETEHAECDLEYNLGMRATIRLRALIIEAKLDLTEVMCACQPGTHGTRFCNFGRKCATLKANGTDVGVTLIAEGLAKSYVCGKYTCPTRTKWCG